MITFATENREKIMKRSLFPIILLMATLQATAQQVVQNKQRHFPKTVPAGNYSGIAWLGGDKYAVANDKSKTAGFHLMTIRTDAKTGDIKEVHADGFMTNGQPNRDEEGICYVPQTNTVFLSSETDGQIIEYSMNGELTGRRLRIPHVYTMAYNNRSFEALTYNATTRRFWTTTENTLKCDGYKPTITNKEVNVVRLQSFGDDLEPLEQYWYMSDSTSTQDYYRRTRPFAYFNEPSLVSATDSVNMKSYSYPSGHAVRGWMYALTLALVVPDATEELMKRAEEYASHIISRLPELRRVLSTAVHANYDGDPAAESYGEIISCYPAIKALVNYRLAHEIHLLGVPLIPRMMTEMAHSETGIDIHPAAQIGEYFSIDHGTGVVIGATCIIGDHVKLYQGVTLGAKSFPLDADGNPIKGIPRHPILQDNVIVYSNATILGRITIGEGSVIGANLWVTEDMEPNTKVYKKTVASK